MNTKNRGFVTTIILGVVALLALGGVFYTQKPAPLVTTAPRETFTIPYYGFSFTYAPEKMTVKVLSAASDDYMPVGREFTALYVPHQNQDFAARIDMYVKVPLTQVIKENRFISKEIQPRQVTINGNIWTVIGDTYLLEKKGVTWQVSGLSSLTQAVLSTATFTQ